MRNFQITGSIGDPYYEISRAPWPYVGGWPIETGAVEVGHYCACDGTVGCGSPPPGAAIVPPPSTSRAFVSGYSLDRSAYYGVEHDGVLETNALEAGVDDFGELGRMPQFR